MTFYLDHSKNKNNYIKLFILFIIIFSFFEYLVGFTLEAIFAENWWDYSYSKYHLNGRITVLNSFLWGVVTVVFRKFIYPLVQKFRDNVIYRIPSSVQLTLSIVLISGILVDFSLSCVRYLR